MEGYHLDDNLSGFFGKPVWKRNHAEEPEQIWYALFTKEAIYVSNVSNYELADKGDVLMSRSLPTAHLVFNGKNSARSPWDQAGGIPPGDPTLWLVMDCWNLV